MFDKHILDFNKNIIGLREFVDLISPFLQAKQDKYQTQLSNLISLALINDVLANASEINPKRKQQLEEEKKLLNSKLSRNFVFSPDDLIFKVVPTGIDKEKPEIKLSVKSNTSIEQHFRKAVSTNNHIQLLYKNSFISLLSSAEWFFSEILHFYYDKFPDAAGIQKKSLTLSELKQFDSLNDAEKYLIDTKIEDILRGNFESWLQVLRSELDLNLGYIKEVENEIVEIYQRRNLIIHNGSRVNSIYFTKVNEENRKKVKLQDILTIDKTYLDKSIRMIQKTFILVASELWKKLDSSDKNRGVVLNDIIYDNLRKSRWDICEGLCFFVMNDSKLEPHQKLIGQLNYWLCKKRTNQFDKILKELQNANFGDKKEIFQLALFSLRDDKKSFFELLPSVLDSQQLNIERLEEFPIFEEMRNTDEYAKFKKTSIHFKVPNKAVKSIKSVKKLSKIKTVKSKPISSKSIKKNTKNPNKKRMKPEDISNDK